MRVTFIRSFASLPYGATFSSLDTVGAGGTELQLLLHAKCLVDLGHAVTVIGSAARETTEHNVRFIFSPSEDAGLRRLMSDPEPPELILTNSVRFLPQLRAKLPATVIVQVCQNGPSFRWDAYLDAYLMVGQGQFAYCSARFPKYRAKMCLVPNVVPWETIYSKAKPEEVENLITWIGGFEKQGLRRWGQAMSVILRAYPDMRWSLCGPSYSRRVGDGALPDALAGLELPYDRIVVKNLPLPQLASEISKSRVVVTSLGGEDGPASYLDGHVFARPVLTANDIVGIWSNPNGAGFRCTSAKECERALRALIDSPALAENMGRAGREWVLSTHTEVQQRSYLKLLLAAVPSLTSSGPEARPQSDQKHSTRFRFERAAIRLASLTSR